MAGVNSVAHSWRTGRHRLTALCAATLAFAACESGAVALGDAEVRSALGEVLDVRIPVAIGIGESIEPSCFSLAREPAGDAPALAAARISVERSLQGAFLRIRSADSIDEPALIFGIIAACPGQVGEYRRDYSVLLDPLASAAGAAAPAIPGPSAGVSMVRSIAATLIARIGDTLESIANAIFPRNRPAKKSYIEALRETNPPLASLGDRDPIPVDTPVALPDLRAFAKSRPPAGTQVASARPPAATQPPAARAQPRAAPRERVVRATPAIERKAPSESAPVARAAPTAVRSQPSPGFVLKLSSGEVDLSRSRAMNDRLRAQLRDRQLVLDADDQVAAVLALRNSVKQLESRVAELQLKLAAMPSSFPTPRSEPTKPASPSVSKAEAPAPSPAPTVAPKVAERIAPVAPAVKPAPAPPVAAAPVLPPPMSTVPTPVVAKPTVAPEPAPTPTIKSEPAPTPTIKPEPAPAATVKAEPAPIATAKTEPAPPATVKTEPAPRPASKPADEENLWLYYGLWVVAAVLIAIAALLAWRLARRRRSTYEEARIEETPVEETPVKEAPTEDYEIVVAEEHLPEELVFASEPAEPEARRELDSDVELATRLPEGNTDDLRRRYIEQRFPEIVNRTIVLDDSGSVVKGARLFYEDGAVARSVELLQFAIERNPGEVRTWLALFEIFRLERLAGEFAELALRFQGHHGKSDYWRKVQYFGREIDPGNALYKEEALNTFETIGPSQARRIAAVSSFDPVAENWLNAPMDFENEVLANDLRKALMAEKGINEEDLVPNPMPALRNVEMFTVA